VVYAKTPLAGPAAVLDYLSRYTHRTAIGNERLVGIQGDTVRLRVRADDQGGKRTTAMPGEQFIARLLQHVLPGGFKRIRHYGLLAQARRLLAMLAANPQAQEDARAFIKRVAGIEVNTCPHCQGRWRVMEQRGADVQALRVLLPRSDMACREAP
jgi:Putative transposase